VTTLNRAACAFVHLDLAAILSQLRRNPIHPHGAHVWYVNREPVDDVLAHFAAGFEITRTQNE
jgi:hypothetical protein